MLNERSGIEQFLLALGLKSSWLKSQGLKGLGLKLGVEKSGVEMSFNHSSIREWIYYVVPFSELFSNTSSKRIKPGKMPSRQSFSSARSSMQKKSLIKAQ